MATVDQSVFDAMQVESQARHARTAKRIRGEKGSNERPDGSVIAQVSMPKAQKERFTVAAKAHGISLSALFRLAADEYIRTHGWE